MPPSLTPSAGIDVDFSRLFLEPWHKWLDQEQLLHLSDQADQQFVETSLVM